MGVFFATQPAVSRTQAHRQVSVAFQAPALDRTEAAKAADEVVGTTPTEAGAAPGKFYVGRFIGALLLFVILVLLGIWTDNPTLADSSKALFGFAGTVFGVVTALLSVESTQK